MLPLIFQSVQEFGVMTSTEFSDLVALSQVTPGPMAVNADICGIQLCRIPGSSRIDDRRMSAGFRDDDDRVRIHRQVQGQQVR